MIICSKCGAFADEQSRVCAKCGSLLAKKPVRTSSASGIRQGRVAARAQSTPEQQPRDDMPVYDSYVLDSVVNDPQATGELELHRKKNRRIRTFDEGAGRPDMQRGVPVTSGTMPVQQVVVKAKKKSLPKRSFTNWAMVFVVFMVVLALLLAAGFAYLKLTPSGQLILAHRGYGASSAAYWQAGREQLDTGDIEGSIVSMRKAWEMDQQLEKPVANIDGLLLLGAALEAGGRMDEAEALYIQLYTEIVPTRPEPYRNAIRLLRDAKRGVEAGELMRLAFEKTEMLSFRQERTEFLPNVPETSLPAGRYDSEREVEFTSPQGFEVYYTDDEEAKLPQEGTLFTGPIQLGEGVVTYRIVSVSESLVSDPLTVSYNVVLPSPTAPYIRLAPNTYKRRQRVWIVPGDPKEPEVTIYYTVDGSMPDADSPIYTGEPVLLPTGKVTLRAIAVNDIGKASNAAEQTYKIDVKPFPLSGYSRTDLFADFELLKTDRMQFETMYGGGKAEAEEMLRGFEEKVIRVMYDWGSALYGRKNARGSWLLLEVDMNKELSAPPRDTHFGNSADEVIAKYKDMSQPAGPSGNRGLYYISGGSETGYGRLFNRGYGTYLLRYVCLHQDGNALTLEYEIKNDKVTRIRHWYAPDF